uniref:Uncharacterized protein n=2 Tax=viral metagenome TaxID=1070528 RepID=A0A6M3JSF1_9ZZZZ
MSQEKGMPIDNFEYLIHHINIDNGKDLIYHCFLYDHIGNMFTIEHLRVENNKVSLNGKQIKNGTYHVIVGLEPTQNVVWSDEEALEHGITPKMMPEGMTYKQKSKEW